MNEEAGQRMIRTHGVDLCTQAFGDSANPALLLIMGATASVVRRRRPCAGSSRTLACMSSAVTTATLIVRLEPTT